MLLSLELDHAGFAEVLTSGEMAGLVHERAELVAAYARNDTGADVVVDDYTTDRAASSVTIRHPQALAWQATTGVLTRAAGAAGLEIALK